jgi:cephalosporin-C deacetylase-like acetyl esterase
MTLGAFAEENSLSPLKDDKVPKNFEELWAGYDPAKEPLETEVLKEWEEEGVVLRVVRYRIGIFKGQKALMGAVYGFPKGGSKLPGLVQIHGGGQFADYRAPLFNAKRGYATISLAWAGRISAPGYKGPTTEWGAVDAYHAPCKNKNNNNWESLTPAPWTLDAVESPRNSNWFLCALAARRALTFLEQQAEVDPGKLGVYGHSMGGKMTVLTAAADARVKAAAPSCGGISDREPGGSLLGQRINDAASLSRISCPIIFLSPANDFCGHIDDLEKAVREITCTEWRLTCAAHHNHQDTAEYMVVGPLWFDQHLKGMFTFPRTPEASLGLKTPDSIPSFTVRPDAAKPILSVDIYYTQQGQMDGKKDDMDNTTSRFWHHADARQTGNAWTAELPVSSTDKPLWVYVNVLYPLDAPVTGAGYYYERYTATQFNLSSVMCIATPDQLKRAGVTATAKRSLVIEAFAKDWQKEWFTYDLTDNWARRTHKIYDDVWQAPPSAKLALDIRSAQPNKLVVGLDSYAAEVPLNGGSEWQSVILVLSDFRNAVGASLIDWKGIRELRLAAKDRLMSKDGGQEKSLDLGAEWQGVKPEFRNLRWVGGLR